MLWALLMQTTKAAASQPDGLKEIAGIAKDLTGALQSVATIIALFIGGLWTFRAFVKGRGNYPRAKLEHLISHRRLPNRTSLQPQHGSPWSTAQVRCAAPARHQLWSSCTRHS